MSYSYKANGLSPEILEKTVLDPDNYSFDYKYQKEYRRQQHMAYVSIRVRTDPQNPRRSKNVRLDSPIPEALTYGQRGEVKYGKPSCGWDQGDTKIGDLVIKHCNLYHEKIINDIKNKVPELSRIKPEGVVNSVKTTRSGEFEDEELEKPRVFVNFATRKTGEERWTMKCIFNKIVRDGDEFKEVAVDPPITIDNIPERICAGTLASCIIYMDQMNINYTKRKVTFPITIMQMIIKDVPSQAPSQFAAMTDEQKMLLMSGEVESPGVEEDPEPVNAHEEPADEKNNNEPEQSVDDLLNGLRLDAKNAEAAQNTEQAT